ERGDASGWSVAWHNRPRARLSLSTVADREDTFRLKVEKRNHGPTGETILLHWSDGVLLPRSESRVVEEATKIQDIVVRVAIKAAEQGTPNTEQKHLQRWQIEEIERETGHRLLQKQAKDILATALSLGKLRYLRGDKSRAAGYYPPDDSRAFELAREAKRSRAESRAAA